MKNPPETSKIADFIQGTESSDIRIPFLAGGGVSRRAEQNRNGGKDVRESHYLSVFSLKVGSLPAIVRKTSSGTTSNSPPSLSRIPFTRLTSLYSRTCIRR